MEKEVIVPVLSLLCLMGAAVCYAVIENIQIRHDKSIWKKSSIYSFWGVNGWTRKHYRNPLHGTFEVAPKNWYYKFFHLKYRENFPGSATMFVFVTDAHHFFQWVMFNLIGLCLALAFWNELGMILTGFAAIRIAWSMTFTLFFEKVFVS